MGVEYLRKLLECKFIDYVESSLSISVEGYELYFGIWKCRIFSDNNENCKKAMLSELEKKCGQYGNVGAKLISLTSLTSLFDLMTEGVKIIHLVRDPRSTWLSRAKIAAKREDKSLSDYLQHNVTTKPSYLDTRTQCNSHEEDLKLLKFFASHSDNNSVIFKNYKLVRYEDIALNPMDSALSLYKFLGIPFHSDVGNWITNNTQGSQKKQFAVRKAPF